MKYFTHIISPMVIKKKQQQKKPYMFVRNVTFNTGFSLFWYQTHLTFELGWKRERNAAFFIHHRHPDMLWYILPSSPRHLGKLLTRFKLRSRLHVIRESTSERNKESKQDTSIMYGPGEMYVCLHQALSQRYRLNRCIYKYSTLCDHFFP